MTLPAIAPQRDERIINEQGFPELRFARLLEILAAAANTTATVGTVTGAANIGDGTGVFSALVGTTLNFKSLIAGANLSIVDNGDDLTINAIGGGGGGGVTNASNLGSGLGIFKALNGTVLEFNSLIAGTGITITDTTDDLTISASGSSLPSGNLGDIIFISTAPNTYSATNAVSVVTTGAVTLQHNGQNRFATGASGESRMIGSVDVTSDSSGSPQTTITLYDLDQSHLLGFFGFGSSTPNVFEIINRRHGGSMTFGGQNAAGSDRNLITADPDDKVTLYHAGSAKLETATSGINILDQTVLQSLGTATAMTHTMRNSVGGVQFHVDNGDGRFRVFQTSSAGALEDVWINATRNGQVALYHNNLLRFETQTFGANFSVQSGDCTVQLIDGTAGALQLIKTNNTVGVIKCVDAGFGINLQAFDAGSVNVNMLAADPDGSVDLYFDATLVARTTTNGMQLDAVGSANCVLEINGTGGGDAGVNMEENGTTKLQVKWDVGATQAHFRLTESAATMRFFADSTGNMARFVGGGVAELYFNGTLELTTKSGGVRIDDELEIDGALNHDGSTVGFYGTTPIIKQTGVAVTAAGVHAALVNLGLIT